MNIHLIIVIMAVLAELLGAVIFLNTRDTIVRMLLSCLGLGFVLVIVFMDILPDAGVYDVARFPYGFLIVLAGALGMYAVGRLGKYLGNYAAVVGLGFHNFCEGVEVAALSAISPVLVIGFLLHKLPEGMVSFSLLDGVEDMVRFLIAFLIALLIPLGAVIPIPGRLEQPVMAFGAGVILLVVSRLLAMIVSGHLATARQLLPKIATAIVIGAVIGGVSCLIA
jgi:ZIP family zinc transporter